MKAELTFATTDDGFRLDGTFFDASGAPRDGAVDALLLVHGSGGRFYQPILLHFAQRLREIGYPSLSLNTLGHESVWMADGGGTPQGNAFELLDRSRLDLKAGIDWLEARGFARVGLLGRSMGAVKAVYYAAMEQDARVAIVVAASPVRLSYSHYLASEHAQEFRETYETFRKMAEGGSPEGLLHVRFPINNIFSAASYLDKHGPEERYNLIRLAHRITCPLLCMSGSRELHPRLKDMAMDLASAATNAPLAQWVEIEGADRGHGGKYEEAAQNVVAWLAQLAGRRDPRVATAAS